MLGRTSVAQIKFPRGSVVVACVRFPATYPLPYAAFWTMSGDVSDLDDG